MCMTRTVYQILVLTLARFLEFRRISGPTRTRVHTRIRTGLGSYTYMCVPSAQCNLPEHRSAGLAGPVRARDPTGVAGPRTSWTGCLDGLHVVFVDKSTLTLVFALQMMERASACSLA